MAGEDWDDDPHVWVVRDAGRKQWKPATLHQIADALAAGKLTRDMDVRHVDSQEWEPVGSLMTRMRHLARSHGEQLEASMSTGRALIQGPSTGGAAMPWTDRIERVARGALWLALASAVLIVPVSYLQARTAEAQTRAAEARSSEAEREIERAAAAVREAIALAENRADKRLSFAAMGPYMTALNTTIATGSLWFTNASPQRGVICVTGVAENQAAQRTSTSLPACQAVAPYESTVHVQLMFAGAELRDTCPTQSVCTLKIKDTPAPVP